MTTCQPRPRSPARASWKHWCGPRALPSRRSKRSRCSSATPASRRCGTVGWRPPSGPGPFWPLSPERRSRRLAGPSTVSSRRILDPTGPWTSQSASRSPPPRAHERDNPRGDGLRSDLDWDVAEGRPIAIGDLTHLFITGPGGMVIEGLPIASVSASSANLHLFPREDGATTLDERPYAFDSVVCLREQCGGRRLLGEGSDHVAD